MRTVQARIGPGSRAAQRVVEDAIRNSTQSWHRTERWCATRPDAVQSLRRVALASAWRAAKNSKQDLLTRSEQLAAMVVSLGARNRDVKPKPWMAMQAFLNTCVLSPHTLLRPQAWQQARSVHFSVADTVSDGAHTSDVFDCQARSERTSSMAPSSGPFRIAVPDGMLRRTQDLPRAVGEHPGEALSTRKRRRHLSTQMKTSY